MPSSLRSRWPRLCAGVAAAVKGGRPAGSLGSAMGPFHVDSEIGPLRTVLLHAPDLELTRLTPGNVEDLLFDEILWVEQARAEHAAFAGVLRSQGVEVYELADLLAEALAG